MPSPLGRTPYSFINLSSNALINSVLCGTKWGGALGTGVELTFSFMDGNSQFAADYSCNNECDGVYALTAKQQAAAKATLAAWSSIANITFRQVTECSTEVGDLRFGGYSGMSTNYAAWAYQPGVTPKAGDIWIGPATSETSPRKGSFDYETFLHEIGHAIGLKHTFKVQSNNKTTLPESLDKIDFSVMSYDGYFTYQPTTPMVVDVLAAQYLYGANMSWQAGNNVYSWGSNQCVFETIWDAGGNDTIDASNQLRSVSLDLREGQYSSIGKTFWEATLHDDGSWSYVTFDTGLAIAYGAMIENAIGSAYDDTLIGNDLDNVLDGRAGIDTMIGGGGNDLFLLDEADELQLISEEQNGGTDTLRIAYSLTADEQVINLNNTDLANIENVTLIGAGRFNLLGNSSTNTLIGNDDSNLIDGGKGADIMSGAGGNDTYYVDDTNDQIIEQQDQGRDKVIASVNYTLGDNLEVLVLQGKDSLNGTGNSASNTLHGNSKSNILDGNGGGDTLIGGHGSDTYIIHDSSDIIIETGSSRRDVDTVNSHVSWTLGERLENLNLLGNDTISGTGNDLRNTLTGNDSDNILDGGAEADRLYGGLGNDTYLVDNSKDLIVETSSDVTEIDTIISSVSWRLGKNLENLHLSASKNLSATGNELNNELIGNDGNNTLDGGQGSDELWGGAGADTFVFSSYKDMACGEQRDRIGDFDGASGDRIDLSTLDADLKSRGNNSFTFIGESEFTGAGQVRFLGGILFGNCDKDLGDDFQIALVGVTRFTADYLIS